jgi:hypothetical protein
VRHAHHVTIAARHYNPVLLSARAHLHKTAGDPLQLRHAVSPSQTVDPIKAAMLAQLTPAEASLRGSPFRRPYNCTPAHPPRNSSLIAAFVWILDAQVITV